jgi:dolichol-phosphate mannosyltransferase
MDIMNNETLNQIKLSLDDTQADALVVPPAISIIIPTRNEAPNIHPILKRLEQVLTNNRIEVIFVDDSTDDTVKRIKELSNQFPFHIDVIARPPERRNGLGKAVIEGIAAAKADVAVVMDGDLQHPPEIIPQMFELLQKDGKDVVVASRLAEGGGTDGLSLFRKCISYGLAVVSHLIFPGNMRGVSDPMTGFFMLRRKAITLEGLQPNGFKILFEILCKHPRLTISEIPFKFGERQAGESKANGREMLLLFKQIMRLRLDGMQNFARFLAVGFTGIFVNSLLMFFFTDVLKVHFMLSALLATQGSTFWNFAWTEKWVYGKQKHTMSVHQRIASYYLINNALLLARSPLLAGMVSVLGIHYILANVLSLAFITMLRFVAADKFIWNEERTSAMTATARQPYYYNIHDIIKVRSMQRLPELGYFKSATSFDNPDIDVMLVGSPSDHKQAASIHYRELMGKFGFEIVINRSDTLTQVYASKLIGMSPHVLYTNVVEPLMRWALVRRGYALMHGACISFDGQALFITAQTDTGKTTTILFTVQNNLKTAKFLSDDMTIFRRDGQVFNYPKPLTISEHTLRAVGGAPLSKGERAFLQIQSRLHSRQGRMFGMLLSHKKFPAATLNAIVQGIIPPPKFMVDKLVPGTQYQNSASLAHIVLIERGENFEAKIDDLEKVNILVANAEDAYGFPPYPVLAEQIAKWDGADLHSAEREIVAATIANIPGTYMRDANYGWYKRLPQLIQSLQTEPVMEEELQSLFKQSVSEAPFAQAGD